MSGVLHASFRSASLLIFLWATAHAATVTGVVEDSTKARVPEASVVLLGPDQQPLASARSDQNGKFEIVVATPGTYSMTITHPGFSPYITELHISGNATVPMVAVLQISQKTERVEVSAGDSSGTVSTDSGANRDAVSVDANTLEDLPVFDQDYIGALSSFLDQGSIGTLGTTIVVDGMEQKNAGVTPSAIQSVKINNDPYSAEYSRPGRGRIEITTKAADSVFHGTANFIFRDYHLNARNRSRLQLRPNSDGFLKAS